MLDKNRHALFPKQCGRDGKVLLPRLLEIVGSVRMKRQERLGKADTNPTSCHRSSLWLALLPRGSAPGGVWHCGVSQMSVWLFSPKDTLAGILR